MCITILKLFVETLIQDNKICTFEFDIIAILIYQQRDTNHSLQNVLHFFQLHLKTLFGKLLFWALDTLAKTEIIYPKNVGAQIAMDFT